MTSNGKSLRADCPLCGKNLTVQSLRCEHVCGRRGGRPKATAQYQVAAAMEGLAHRMSNLALEGPAKRRKEEVPQEPAKIKEQ